MVTQGRSDNSADLTENSVTAGKVDPLRITVRVADLGLTGYAASEWLEAQHQVIAELATDQVKLG